MTTIQLFYAIGLSCIVFILVYVSLNRSIEKAQEPAIGDYVIISGKFNPDTGWVKSYEGFVGMEGTTGLRGDILKIDQDGTDFQYYIRLENGFCWYYNREDFIIL